MPSTHPPEFDVGPLGMMAFTAHNPYTVALRLHEAKVKEIEGPRTNALIAAMNYLAGAGANEDAPWCGSFVGFCHWVLGYACPKNPAGAREWLTVGLEIPLSRARRGDVIIFWRDKPDGWKGHVGFLHKFSEIGDPIILGGNQSDQVSLVTMPRSRVLGARRPQNKLMIDVAITNLPAPQSAGSEV